MKVPYTTKLGMVENFLKNWWFTFAQITIYIATFTLWKVAPSRVVFVVGGMMATAIMAGLLETARRKKYFVTRTDFLIHLLVTFDLLVEGLIYEIYALLMRIYGHQADAVEVVHNHHGFILCALVFFAILFGYRVRKLG